jgi:regulator of replication initiation timing
MDEEDVRFDVFDSIYNMLHDNIQLRIKNNKLSKRILSQSELILDKSVTQNYNFDKNNKEFKDKIAELTEQFNQIKDK